MTPRRRQLCDAAVTVFARKGYAAATVQEIADVAGIRKASVYKHVAGKEDLLFDVLEIAHAQTIALMQSVDALDLSPLERLHEYLRRHVLWYLGNVQLLHVFFREWRALTSPERRAITLERRRAYDRFIRRLIIDCQAAGQAAPGVDVKYASFYMLGAVNATPEWFPRGSGGDAEAVARDCADLAVRMIRT